MIESPWFRLYFVLSQQTLTTQTLILMLGSLTLLDIKKSIIIKALGYIISYY